MAEKPISTEDEEQESEENHPSESDGSVETETQNPVSEVSKEDFQEINVDVKAPKLIRQCSLLLKGNLDNKLCKFPQNKKRIFGLKEIHKNGKHKEDQVRFYLKYFDENGYRQNIETDKDTAKLWYLDNKEQQNLKDPIYKGNRKTYYFKKQVIE